MIRALLRSGALLLAGASAALASEAPPATEGAAHAAQTDFYSMLFVFLLATFIGLGVITRVTFRTVTPAPNVILALVPCPDEASAIALAGRLGDASMRTWRDRSPAGIDAAAIEHMDRRSLEIVREDGADRRNNVVIPEGTGIALLVQLELDPEIDAAGAFERFHSSPRWSHERGASPPSVSEHWPPNDMKPLLQRLPDAPRHQPPDRSVDLRHSSLVTRHSSLP